MTLLGLLAVACSDTPPHSTRFGSLVFTPCTIGDPAARASAQCASLTVPENRADPSSRAISLAVAWLPASAKADRAPVFLIAGGPGLSARDTYAGVAQSLPELHEHHDLILVDQRGIGGSSPLNCTRPPSSKSEERPEVVHARLLACLESVSQNADVRFYSTTEAMFDLDDVRRALQVEHVNLYGASYGTRVAQQYAKHFAAHTRTVTLDGVAPNSLVLVGNFASDLDDALEKQLTSETRERLLDLLSKLDAAPMAVHYRSAESGALTTGTLTREEVVELVRAWAYRPSSMAMLPLLLSEATAGRLEVLAALAKGDDPDRADRPASTAPLSVLCTEDASELPEPSMPPMSLLGDSAVRVLKAACAVWPKGERPPDFREPLTGPVPVLLLSGELDPVTPPRYAEAVRTRLPNGRHLVARGQGHQVVTVGCMPRLFAHFVDTADAMNLDARCLDSISDPRPVSGFSGWSP